MERMTKKELEATREYVETLLKRFQPTARVKPYYAYGKYSFFIEWNENGQFYQHHTPLDTMRNAKAFLLEYFAGWVERNVNT